MPSRVWSAHRGEPVARKMGRDTAVGREPRQPVSSHFANEPVAGFESGHFIDDVDLVEVGVHHAGRGVRTAAKGHLGLEIRTLQQPRGGVEPRGKHQLQGRNRRRQRREVGGGIRRLFVVAQERDEARAGARAESADQDTVGENFRLLPQSHPVHDRMLDSGTRHRPQEIPGDVHDDGAPRRRRRRSDSLCEQRRGVNDGVRACEILRQGVETGVRMLLLAAGMVSATGPESVRGQLQCRILRRGSP